MVILVQDPFSRTTDSQAQDHWKYSKLAQQTVSVHHHMLLIEAITFFSFTLDYL